MINQYKVTWYSEQDNKIEDIFLTILKKEWIDQAQEPLGLSYSVNSDLFPRIYQLLKEDSEMFTIAFLLQHFRVKIYKLNQNFEKDSFVAGRLLKEFDLNFKNKPENHIKLRDLVEYYTRNQHDKFLDRYSYPVYSDKTNDFNYLYSGDSTHYKWNRQENYYKENSKKDLLDLLLNPVKKQGK